VLAVLAVFGASTLPSTAESRDGWDLLKTPFKDFSLQDLSGRKLRASDLRGKVVVVDFWATWCAPCIKELPDLAVYQQRLAPRQDVTFLSLNVTEEKDVVTKFVKEKKISFPVYLGDSLVESFEVSSFPTKLVLDLRKPASGSAGLLRFRREGTSPVASIEARVTELLAEKN